MVREKRLSANDIERMLAAISEADAVTPETALQC
jgi:hypothetical protein